MRAAAQSVLLILTALSLSACGPTRYTDYASREQSVPVFERSVAVQVGSAFYRPLPDCAVVLPAAGRMTPPLRRAIEETLYRHLVTKIPNVVGPKERARKARSLAVDLRRPDGRAVFARAVGCPVMVEARVWNSSDDFALVWSRKSLDLEVVMVRGETLLWKARHDAGRSDGGLPLSPLSAPIAIARASSLYGDNDAMISLVDDTVRRIVVSLPDVR